jgi:hypothetical protein
VSPELKSKILQVSFKQAPATGKKQSVLDLLRKLGKVPAPPPPPSAQEVQPAEEENPDEEAQEQPAESSPLPQQLPNKKKKPLF